MKAKIFKLALNVLFGLFLTATFVSCEKDEIDPPNFTSDLIGKWNVSNDGAEYGSFEFTKDKKYIIEQRVSSLRSAPANSILRSSSSEPNTVYIIIIFGDYSTLSEDGGVYNLNLGDFGLIKITISESGAEIEVNGEVFDITKDNNTISGNKDKTELLCHTWNWKEVEEDDSGTFTFTSNGTYIGTNDEDPDDLHSGEWKWSGNNNIEIGFYSYNEHWTVDVNGNLIMTERTEEYEITSFKVIKLTETELILSQETEDGPYIINFTRR